MENQIVITKYNEIETIDSRIVANELGIEHRALIQSIRKHQDSIENNFNLVTFEMLPRLEGQHGGGDLTIAHLTEDQAIFVGSLSRNNQQVIEFKAKIVKAFSIARKSKELTRKEILLLALESEERALAAESKILELQPKVEAFDRVIDNSTTYTLDTVSDIINVGRNKLSEKLKQIGWAIKDSTKGTSSTRKVEEIGYARTFFETIIKGNQEIKVKKIVVTKKGLDYLVNNYSKIFA